jgi:hypothetical protein
MHRPNPLLLLLLLLEFTSRAGAPVAINPDAVEAVFERPGHHADIRLLSGALVELANSYADVVSKLRNGP